MLEAAGYSVQIPESRVCCGLTWISTGPLDGARRQLRRTLEALQPAITQGMPIVGLESSCTAVLCCGLAGNFGVEKGHYDVSVAVAEQSLLPAVRSADAATVCWPMASRVALNCNSFRVGAVSTSHNCWLNAWTNKDHQRDPSGCSATLAQAPDAARVRTLTQHLEGRQGGGSEPASAGRRAERSVFVPKTAHPQRDPGTEERC